MITRTPRSILALTIAVYLFLHLPILVLVVFSFNDSNLSASWVGFTLGWYYRLLERPDIMRGLKASLIVGGVSTVVSAVLGTLVALALARYRFRGRTALEGFLYVPIVTPEIVVGISLAGRARMRFRPYAGKTDRKAAITIELAPRSVYVMQDEIRWRWQHHIPPTKELRYSITFRTLSQRNGVTGDGR